MHRMGNKARLIVCALMIVCSALYALLISLDRNLAEAVALGYIALLLTAFTLVHVWRQHE